MAAYKMNRVSLKRDKIIVLVLRSIGKPHIHFRYRRFWIIVLYIYIDTADTPGYFLYNGRYYFTLELRRKERFKTFQ